MMIYFGPRKLIKAGKRGTTIHLPGTCLGPLGVKAGDFLDLFSDGTAIYLVPPKVKLGENNEKADNKSS
jgi:hypothetical protein